MKQSFDSVVIGGGIAGLTAAFRLKKSGQQVQLLEKSGRVGGVIQTIHENGSLLELGPHTFLTTYKELWELADALGLSEEKMAVSPDIGNRRYIYRNNRLHPVVPGPRILFSRLLSLKAKLRLLKEPFIPTRQSNRDESVADFVRRRIGHEFLDYLLTPMISGIYAGNPEQLSMQSVFPKMVLLEKEYGSLIKALFRKKNENTTNGPKIKSAPASFKGGIQTLINALAIQLNDSIHPECTINSIEKESGGWKISYTKNGSSFTSYCHCLLLATPAFVAADILQSISPTLTGHLRTIAYAPIVVVHTLYKKVAIPLPLDGFGFLVPRGEKVRMLGSIWSSALFPDRAPRGSALLTEFLGGMLDHDILAENDSMLVDSVKKDLRATMGISENPDIIHIQRHSRAIPQYHLGHPNTKKAIESELESLGTIYLTGNYLNGISVNDTIKSSNGIAQRIMHIEKKRHC